MTPTQTLVLPLTGLSVHWQTATSSYLVLTHDDQNRLPAEEITTRWTQWSRQTTVITRAEPLNNQFPTTPAWALWGETSELSIDAGPAITLADAETLSVHRVGGIWAAETATPMQPAVIRWPHHTVHFRVPPPGRRR